MSTLRRENLFNYTGPENSSDLFCSWDFDEFLTWPPTKVGSNYSQNCPNISGFNSSKIVYKVCSLEGQWIGDTKSMRFDCINDNIKIKSNIVTATRYLELVGYSLSLVSLIASLIIFLYFRTLRNNRTRIHRNLFFATLIHVIVRLVLYTDQELRFGIERMPYFCECCYILLEYARTAMFCWMFVEGLYLHNVVTFSVFREHMHYLAYSIVGWAAPAIMATTWAVIMFLYSQISCWTGYNYLPYYWIMEGPRVALMIINFFFLLAIIRVLISKLRQSEASEVEQARKSVRAAILLLPLLGVPNLLQMVFTPLDWANWKYALWSYSTHFLASFQGFFIALIYCFLNGEVRSQINSKLLYSNSSK